MMKKRSIYWLTIESGEQHQRKSSRLEDRGYEVIFLKTLDSLLRKLAQKRVSIIVLGDEGPEVSVVKAISLLGTSPDIQGARLVLSTSRHSDVVLRAAACEGFRDILPIDMNEKDWITRFIFSTAGKPAMLPAPTPQVAFPSAASLSIPARIVWISKQKIWVESKISAPLGVSLSLTGPLAQSMGNKALTITVDKCQRKNLTYRFSEAMIASWNLQKPEPQKIDESLTLLSTLNVGPRCKVFLAIQSPALRNTLIKYLDQSKFDVHSALQKQSMVSEPQFFSPRLVFVENRLCCGESMELYRTMVTNLSPTCTIIILGNSDNFNVLKTLAGGRKLLAIKRIPVNFSSFIDDLLKESPQNDSENSYSQANQNDTYYIPADHEFSLAEIKMSARLLLIHPSMAKVALPYQVGNFGICRIESKAIKEITYRFPYSKIAASYHDPLAETADFPNITECHFCNIGEKESHNLNNALFNNNLHSWEHTKTRKGPYQRESKRQEEIEISEKKPSVLLTSMTTTTTPKKTIPQLTEDLQENTYIIDSIIETVSTILERLCFIGTFLYRRALIIYHSTKKNNDR